MCTCICGPYKFVNKQREQMLNEKRVFEDDSIMTECVYVLF